MKIAIKNSSIPVVLPEQSETHIEIVPLNQQRERVIEWPHTSATNIKIHYIETHSKRFLPHLKTIGLTNRDAEIGYSLLQQFLISKR